MPARPMCACRSPRPRGWFAILFVVAGAVLAACSPPESTRTRGERGADVGNRRDDLAIHGPRDPFRDTPHAASRP